MDSKGYTYDKAGRKSVVAEGIVVTRDMVNPTANTPSVSSGTQGETSYYRSNVTVRMNGGSDVTSPMETRMTYRVTGTAKGNGAIGGTTVTTNQVVDTGEVEIANGGTFTITTDGTWTVTAYSYDYSGRKSAASTGLVFTRDTVGPTISSFTRTARAASTINVSVSASDALSGIGTTSSTYTYYQGSTSKGTSASNTYQYTGLSAFTNYTLKVIVKDKSGNTSEKSLTTMTAGSKNFAYTGAAQTFTVPETGKYKLEVWGAQGGTGRTQYTNIAGGKGGYSVGIVSLSSGTTIYAYVGGKGTDWTSSASNRNGGFNGGGTGRSRDSQWSGSGGGGGSDFRIASTSLYARIIVAGGGGGAGCGHGTSHVNAGHGGGTSGIISPCGTSYGGSATAGGSGGWFNGSFGQGGGGTNMTDGFGGGGGGWYGGGASSWCTGGGGSGYVYTSSTASQYPSGCLLNSSYYLSNAATYAGNTSFPSTSGGTETGHSGNGYARITLVE